MKARFFNWKIARARGGTVGRLIHHMEVIPMSKYTKLQSALNRSIHTPLERLSTFFEEAVPADYMELAGRAKSEEAKKFLEEVAKAQNEARKLLNRLTALRFDLELGPDPSPVVLDGGGQPRIAEDETDLGLELNMYWEEEQEEIQDRFGQQ